MKLNGKIKSNSLNMKYSTITNINKNELHRKSPLMLKFNLIKSRINNEDVQSHPEISFAFTKFNKFKFNLLSPTKTKISRNVSFENEDKEKLIEKLNSFSGTFANYEKNMKYSLRNVNKLGKENKLFIKRFRELEKKWEK